jgi:hypothetical protein
MTTYVGIIVHLMQNITHRFTLLFVCNVVLKRKAERTLGVKEMEERGGRWDVLRSFYVNPQLSLCNRRSTFAKSASFFPVVVVCCCITLKGRPVPTECCLCWCGLNSWTALYLDCRCHRAVLQSVLVCCLKNALQRKLLGCVFELKFNSEL